MPLCCIDFHCRFANTQGPTNSWIMNHSTAFRLALVGCFFLFTSTLVVHATCANAPSGLVNWWPAEGNAIDSVGTNNGTLSGAVSYTTGEVGQTFVFTNGAVTFDANTANFGTNNFTVEFWLKTTAPVSESYQIGVMDKRPTCDYYNAMWTIRLGGSGTGGALRAEITSDGVTDSIHLVGTKLVNDGAWHHIALTRNGPTLTLYVDGALDNQQTVSTVANISNGTPFVVGQSTCQCCDGTHPFSGSIDELSIYNRALTLAEVQSIYNAGNAGKCLGPPTAPTITSQPNDLTVYVGDTATFSVGAIGTAPLSYQWSFNSNAISGATTDTLVIPNAQLTNAGSYSVLVSNSVGSKQSSNAVLTVNQLACVTAPTGLVDWWKGESSAADSAGSNPGTLFGGVSYGSAEVGQGFVFNTLSNRIDFGANAGVFGTSDFSVEFWLNTTVITTPGIQMGLIEKRAACNSVASFWGIRMVGYGTGPGMSGFLEVDLSSDNSQDSQNLNSSVSLSDGLWHHVVFTRHTGTLSFYIDGFLDTEVTAATTANITTSTHLIVGQSVCGTRVFGGSLDEISLYTHALTPAEVYSLYSAGSAGKCPLNPTGPSITSQPASQTVIVGQTAQFSVGVTGSNPFSYQWLFNGANLAQETNATLTINPAQFSDAGTYAVIVSNAVSSVQSSNATLTVVPVPPPPSCTNAPSGLLAWWAAEGNAADSVGTNNGTIVGGLTFVPGKVGTAFQFNGTDSAVNFNTNVTNFRTNDFTVEFWIKTSATRNEAVMEKRTVCNLGSAWNVRIGDSSQTHPGKLFFEILTSGADYQVYSASPINDGAWHHAGLVRSGLTLLMYIDGQQSTTVAMTGTVDIINNSIFRMGQNVCQCCDGTSPYSGTLDEISIYGRALSASDIQNIYNVGSAGKCPIAPFITTQPTNTTVTVGATATFSVSASGTPSLSYLWNFNGNNLLTATNPALVITNAQFTNAGTYFVVVTNTAGSATSSNAVLVVGSAPTITSGPSNLTALQFTTVAFSAAATGSAPLNYQWQHNGANISGATNTSFTMASVQKTDSGSYRVVVSNSFGATTSGNALLTVFIPNVRMVNSAVTLGSVTVPVQLVAGGDESTVGFSINYPTTNLVYSSTVLGSNAAGALLTVNTNQTSAGQLGLGIFYLSGGNFAPGTQEVARVTFRTAILTNAVTNTLTFGDTPTPRQVGDTNFNTLVATYSNATVTIPITDLEGDVAPRTNGSHTLGINDWVQTGRFVAGLDTISNSLELMRADCAPRTNLGNGILTIADWVQAGRYALGFDPPTPIGGPTNFTSFETPKSPTRPVTLQLLSQNGTTNTVAVHLNAQGDENALGFSVNFDPTLLQFANVVLGSGASGAVLNVNSSQAASGRVGVAVGASPGNALAAGDLEIARLTLISSFYGSNSVNASFGDQPILREVADANATTESASYSGASFTATGLPLPALSAMLSDTNIVLSWPLSTGFNLESASPLGTNWVLVTDPATTNGSTVVLTQAISADQVFYRLHHP